MQLWLARFNRFFEQIPALARKSKLAILIAIGCITVFMAYSLADRFVMEISHELWFEEGAQPIVDRDLFRSRFGSDEDLFIVYQPKSGDVFSESALITLDSLQEDLLQASRAVKGDDGLGRALDVDSLINAPYQIADGDTLVSKKLIGADFPETSSERERRRQIADSQDNFRRVFYSTDYRFGAIRLKTNFGVEPAAEAQQLNLFSDESSLLADDMAGFSSDVQSDGSIQSNDEPVEFKMVQLGEYVTFMKAVREITQKPEYQNFTFYYVGNPAIQDFSMGAVNQASLLLALMTLTIMCLLWFIFRSLSAVIWPLLIITFSTIWGLGLATWVVKSFSSMLIVTLMLAIAVTVAGCVHILSAYLHFRNEKLGHDEALSKAYKKTGLAVFLTTITTMTAMLTLATTDMPLMQAFGWSSAFSVGACFVLLVSIFPLMLDAWHPVATQTRSSDDDSSEQNSLMQSSLAGLARFTERYAKAVVLGYLAFLVLLLYGASILKVDSNFAKVAKEGSDLQVAVDLADTELMGGLNLEIYLDFKRRDAFKDPEVLKKLDRLQQSLNTKYPDKVIKSVSLANVVKDTNRVMNEGREEFYRVPNDAVLTAQLLYLFNNANGDDRRELVTDDYSKSHISFMLRNGGSYEYLAFYEDVRAEIKQIFEPLRQRYPDMQVTLTGGSYLMMAVSDHLVWSQLQSFGLALVSITIIMMLTLGSKQSGLIAIIPNLVPALFVFGVMGYLGISLNGDMMLVAPVIIGIAVDDTIHFLTYYRNVWFETGNVAEAVRSTLKEVGAAVAFTSLILGLGFGVLGFSYHLGLAKPGIAGAFAIFVALLSDLLFLPALIHWLKPDLGRKRALARLAANESSAY